MRQTIQLRTCVRTVMAVLVLVALIGAGTAAAATTARDFQNVMPLPPVPAGCQFVHDNNGGLMTCPHNVPLPVQLAPAGAPNTPTGAPGPSPDFASIGATYDCGWGVQCNYYFEMGEGANTANWYAWDRNMTFHGVAQYEGFCYDPSGCIVGTYWGPPSGYWEGAAVSVQSSDTYLVGLDCWCSSGGGSCSLD